MSDEYLWDQTGTPDPEVERLERLLAEARFDGAAPEMPARAGRPGLRFAAAAVVLLGLGALAFVLAMDGGREPPPAVGWAYQLVPVGSAERPMQPGTLVAGGWIETDAQTRADLTVADIGRIDLEPRSRLQSVRTGRDEHRLRLERGRMEAVVDAPPRLFVTETPAGDAVDLGCMYTLEVDDEGNGLLEVMVGMVMYERGGYEAYVPAKARCEAQKDKGMGTPYFESASLALVRALRRLDFDARETSVLREVLGACEARDTLTLWNLLQHPRLDRGERAKVLDRIEDFEELPIALTREGVLDREEETLLRLREHLERTW